MTEKHAALTTLQRRFVEEYIANGFKDAKTAASKAGASESTAKNAYRAFLGSDVVRTAIDEAKEIFKQAARDRISGHADAAIDALVLTLESTYATTAGARVSAAKALLEMSGIGEPIKHEHTGKNGAPIEHSIIVSLRDRLTDRRRVGESSSESGDGPEAS